jgi:hypothetical protein
MVGRTSYWKDILVRQEGIERTKQCTDLLTESKLSRIYYTPKLFYHASFPRFPSRWWWRRGWEQWSAEALPEGSLRERVLHGVHGVAYAAIGGSASALCTRLRGTVVVVVERDRVGEQLPVDSVQAGAGVEQTHGGWQLLVDSVQAGAGGEQTHGGGQLLADSADPSPVRGVGGNHCGNNSGCLHQQPRARRPRL